MALFKIELPFKIKKPILAAGADIKNSICFAYHRFAFLNQVINNLELQDNFNKFQREISSIPKSFGLLPKIIAFDKHPEYFSSKYILNLPRTDGLRIIPVQHHHAHIASCMAENKLTNQKIIGIAFDGTGFGDDNTLWGAEFLISDYRNFSRAAHLRYIPLLGGIRAIYQPWRVASAWLYLAFRDNFLDIDLDFIKKINKKDWGILRKIWKQNFNSPPASSIGRFFDAVAALLFNIHHVEFEAEAAINLESVASGYKSKIRDYRFRIKKTDQGLVIDPILTFRDIVYDLKNKCSKEEIAARFHFTVAQMIKKTCLKIRNNTKINTVILTGGVFQNKILLNLSSDLLKQEEFCVLTHKILPCSDVSISLGQVAVASHAN